MNSLDIMDDESSQVVSWFTVFTTIGFITFFMDDIVGFAIDNLNGDTAFALVIGLAVFWFVYIVPLANAWGKGESLDVYQQKEADVDTSEDSVWDEFE